MHAFLKGPLGLTPRALMSRLVKAAATGDLEAKMALHQFRERNVKAGMPAEFPGLSRAMLKAWKCPTCSSPFATAHGTDNSITCTKGHRVEVRAQVWKKKLDGLRAEAKSGRIASPPAPTSRLTKPPAKSGVSRLLRPPPKKF